MTQPLVLFRIRRDVFAGKCVAGMISPPRLHTSCSSKVISVTASIASLLHRVRTPWILEDPCDSCVWEVPKIQTLAARRFLRLWISKQKTYFVSNWECGQQGFASYWTKLCWDWWTLQCDWTKITFIQKDPRHAQSSHLHVITPALQVCLSRLPWFSR